MSAEQNNSKKPAAGAASPAGAPGKPSAPGAGGGAPSPSSSSRGSSSKTREPVAGQCFAVSCKKPDHRMSFCDEHYEHFKFGLINRKGEPVPDYDKKFEHYQAYLKRLASTAKAA